MNMQQMMKQAQNMQKKMAETQQRLAETEVNGSAGGDMVKTTIFANGKVKSIDINPSIIDPEDPDMLADLVVAAINNARDEADKISSDAMGQVAGGAGLPAGLF